MKTIGYYIIISTGVSGAGQLSFENIGNGFRKTKKNDYENRAKEIQQGK